MAEVTGGCMCGKVRYTVEIENDEAYLCHCRMCQRATGGVSIAFTNLKKAQVTWDKTGPHLYASSPIAERGFCRECGTPLSFEYIGSKENHLTVGSLDEPGRLRPVAHYGFESHVSSFFTDDGLPRSQIEDDHEYVAKWKAAHGQDSMPGPLDPPT